MNEREQFKQPETAKQVLNELLDSNRPVPQEYERLIIGQEQLEASISPIQTAYTAFSENFIELLKYNFWENAEEMIRFLP